MKISLHLAIVFGFLMVINTAKADQYLVQCGEQARASAIGKLDQAIQSAQSTKAIQSYMERMRYKLQLTQIYSHNDSTYGWMVEGISWFWMSLANVGISATNSIRSMVIPHQPGYELLPTNRLAPSWKTTAYVPMPDAFLSDVGVNGKYHIYLVDRTASRCGEETFMTYLLLHEAAHLMYFGECSADRMAEIVQTLAGGGVYSGTYECSPGSWDSSLNEIYPKTDSERANPGGSQTDWWGWASGRSSSDPSNAECKGKCEYSYNKPACLKFYCKEQQTSYNPLSPVPPSFQYNPNSRDQDIARREIERVRQEELRRQEIARRAADDAYRAELERRRQQEALQRRAELERQRREWEARNNQRSNPNSAPPGSDSNVAFEKPVELTPQEKYLQCKYQCRKEGFTLYSICVEQTCEKLKP